MMRATALLALLSIAPLSIASGCSSETALLVEIEAPFTVPDVVDQLEIEAVGSTSGAMLSQRFAISSAFPHSFAIRAGGDESEEVTITVTARKRSTPSMSVGELVAARTVVDHFVSGEVRTVRVLLEASCVGVTCPAEQTCLGGRCVDPGVDAGMDGGEADAGADGGEADAHFDGGPDAGRDGGPDGGSDAGPVVPPDSGPDAGACTAMCEGWAICGADGCVDTATDARHCGGCGTTCAGAEACGGGTCRSCGAGSTWCSGECVFPTDVRYCGGCPGVRCAADQICTAGACAAAGPGQSCATPRDLGMATGTFPVTTSVDRHTHLHPTCLDDDFIKDGAVVRWTAPSAGTYRFSASFTASGMGPVDAAIELFAGSDSTCSCPLPGSCVGVRMAAPTVTVDRAMTAGESVLILLALGRQATAVTQLTVTAL